jgi:hypothetical protein
MQKVLLYLSFSLLSLASFSQGGYLPNSSFENWTTATIYENPDFWQTSNYEGGNNFVNAQKSTDAQHLNYSIMLQNVLVNNDTAFAYTFLGTANNGPDGGIPYAANVDEVNGYYKGTVGTGDTAFVLIIKFLAGNVASMDMLPIFTSQTGWTPFTFLINSTAQDSIFVGLLSTNPFSIPMHANPAILPLEPDLLYPITVLKPGLRSIPLHLMVGRRIIHFWRHSGPNL